MSFKKISFPNLYPIMRKYPGTAVGAGAVAVAGAV